jgi:hypothetical protein
LEAVNAFFRARRAYFSAVANFSAAPRHFLRNTMLHLHA